MKKSTNTNTAKKLKDAAKILRAKAALLQESSDASAETALKALADFKIGVDAGLDIYDGVIEIFKSASSVAEVVLNDKGVRAKTKTLIQNCVTDLSHRLCEFSNIIDYTSKSKEILEAVEQAAKGIAKAEARINKAQESILDVDLDSLVDDESDQH